MLTLILSLSVLFVVISLIVGLNLIISYDKENKRKKKSFYRSHIAFKKDVTHPDNIFFDKENPAFR